MLVNSHLPPGHSVPLLAERVWGKWASKFPDNNKGIWAVASLHIAPQDQRCAPVRLPPSASLSPVYPYMVFKAVFRRGI